MLPFILRRTKRSVATELPTKTIVDVMCPLSTVQQELYDGFLRGKMMTDDMLEQQLKDIKQQGASHPRQQHKTSSSASLPSAVTTTTITITNNTGNHPLPHESSQPLLHPLKALLFLKLVGLHPALVISPSEHRAYHTRLLDDPYSSGKTLSLAKLLVDR